MLEMVKLKLQITEDDFDSLLNLFINSAKIDLGIAGVTTINETDNAIIDCICSFVDWKFNHDDEMRKVYEMQKAQFITATGYTTWSNEE